jgi:hypothetical protein
MMPLRVSLALVALAAATGCSSLSCGANQHRLAQLRDGMSYEQVSQIMGCGGTRVSEHGLDPGEYATIEWAGPDSLLFSRTHVVFFDRKLQAVMLYARGGSERTERREF